MLVATVQKVESAIWVPWTARRSNQSILKEINTEYSLEGLMLQLKLQYFGQLMRRANSLGKKPWCWERLKAGEEGADRGWNGWMYHWPNRHEWSNSERQWRTGKPGMLQPMGSQSQTWLASEQQHVYKYLLLLFLATPQGIGILVPWPRMETSHLSVEAQSHNH